MTPEVLNQLIDNNSVSIDDYNAVIVRRKDDNTLSFATICIKPHWSNDGIMFTSGTWDATKFPLNSSDLEVFYNYITKSNPDYDIDIVLLLSRIDSQNENWRNEVTRGSYYTDGIFKGQALKEESLC